MKKLLNKKGFTLMEMLIVVAIIVILVAISIPMFTMQLDKAKKATDDANLRAAKAAAVSAYLITDDDVEIEDGWWYDLTTGEFSSTKPAAYAQSSDNSGKAIQVAITGSDLTVDWQSVPKTE